ncbi:MAG: hypothetical protein B6244_02535 [Candidatus Cloacimonetes bacterium 4572_55]|nr:MAG: hypothetical protein B6244_02535 [Candidatus Cloacimonetes bacterium 4572_55]
MMKTAKKFRIYGYIALMALVIGIFVPRSWSAGHEVYDVTVKRLGQTSQIIIGGNGPFNYKDFLFDNPPRIVIDCIGSEHNLPGPRTYSLDRGGITAIRASYTEEPTPKVRIIVDLQTRLPYVVFKEGKNLVIALDAVTSEPFAQWQASKFYDYRRPPQTDLTFQAKGHEKPTSVPAYSDKASVTVTFESREEESAGDDFLINVEYEKGDLVKIIRQFANWTKQNIVISPNVSGTVSVSLRNVPVRTALDIILKINGYAVVEEPGDIWRVASITEINAAMAQEQSRAKEMEMLAPLVTEVIEIEYASAGDIINSFPENTQNERAGTGIQVNERTNSLIVTDTPTNIDRIRIMIDKLDTPTQQVNIEAQVVEISRDVSRELGMQWSSEATQEDDEGGSLLVLDFSERLTDELSDLLSGGGKTTTTVTLNAVLTALESANKAHVISRPNISVLNHQSASIVSGAQVPYIKLDDAGNALTEFIDTGVQLSVTPHVNPNNRITLEVTAEVSSAVLAGSGVNTVSTINTKNANTRIMVDNGATAVIGGLISNDESISESRLPILSKLPLVGRLLFTSKRRQQTSREILILITPRILGAPPESLY